MGQLHGGEGSSLRCNPKEHRPRAGEKLPGTGGGSRTSVVTRKVSGPGAELSQEPGLLGWTPGAAQALRAPTSLAPCLKAAFS